MSGQGGIGLFKIIKLKGHLPHHTPPHQVSKMEALLQVDAAKIKLPLTPTFSPGLRFLPGAPDQQHF